MRRAVKIVATIAVVLLSIVTVSVTTPVINSAQAGGTVPSAPRNVSAVANGTSVTVTWSAPSSNGGSAVTDYRVQYRSTASFPNPVYPTDLWTEHSHAASTSTTATITGLTVGRHYEFRVAATNANGDSPWNQRILVAEITATTGHSECVIRQDRSTFCKTDPDVIFDGTTPATRVIEITTIADGVCLLFEIGTIKCGGTDNSYGQLGDGTSAVPSESPWTDVFSIDGSTPAKTAVKVAMGNKHACALMANGQAQCWGRNDLGQLGYGGTSNSPVPDYVDSLTAAGPATTAIDIAASDDATCVILQDSTVNCWGALYGEALGAMSYFDGGTDATKAVSFSGGPGPEGVYRDGSGTGAGFCVITVSTQVVCWASEYLAPLVGPRDSNTQTNESMLPTLVSGVTGVTQIAVGQDAVCALFTAGNVSCWGSRSRGQLGDGENSSATGVVPVVGLDGSDADSTATSISVANARGFCATRQEGDTVCWGMLGMYTSYEPAPVDHARFVFISSSVASPPSTPAAPGAVAGNGQVTVTVTANAGGIAPTSYSVVAVGTNPQKTCQVSDPGASLSCVITGLTNGVAYTFTAFACFGVACSSASAPSSAVTPTGGGNAAPGAPRNVEIAGRAAGALSVRWAAPASSGGSAVTGYTLAWREVGTSWLSDNTKSVVARSTTVNGLTAGKAYQFRVNARNATVTGEWSGQVTGIVPVKAPAPRNVKGVVDGMKITLTWDRVTTPSHSPVLKYAAYCAVGSEEPARANASPTATSATVTVTQHKLYVCRVGAVTAAGRSTDSAPVRVRVR